MQLVLKRNYYTRSSKVDYYLCKKQHNNIDIEVIYTSIVFNVFNVGNKTYILKF